MNNSNTITVSELIAILELHDPDSLISFRNEYTPINRQWDKIYMLGNNKALILTGHYEYGNLIRIEPYL